MGPAQEMYFKGLQYVHSSMMPAYWYSTPEAGRCSEGQIVGRDCWWRVLETKRFVNNSCVEDRIIDRIVKRNQTCFDGCPDPADHASDCWVTCFYSTILGNSTVPGVTHDEITADFQSAFLDP